MERQIRRPHNAEIDQAVEIVKRHLAPTPLIASGLSNVFLKLETFQPTGSFKVRGALVALSLLPADVDVVTASAGNHGLGMAHAAKLLERNVTVVVPTSASPAKVAKLKTYPIRLIEFGSSTDEAERHAPSLANERCAYVSPYNDPLVIAGQSTIGFELQQQMTDLHDANEFDVVCSVGGGGLCAGLATWVQSRKGVSVFGVEAASSPAVSSAIAAGHVTHVDVLDTLADGLAGQIEEPCITWEIMRDANVSMSKVSEQDIRSAIQWLFVNHGIVVEGSGAVALAGIQQGYVEVKKPTVVVLSGRNIKPSTYAEVLAS